MLNEFFKEIYKSSFFVSVLTDINESTGRSFAELLALVAQCHLHHSWDMSGRCLHSDGMWCDHLTPDEHCTEDHLQSVEEVVAHDNHLRSTGRPTLARGYCLDAWRGHRKWGIESCNGKGGRDGIGYYQC